MSHCLVWCSSCSNKSCMLICVSAHNIPHVKDVALSFCLFVCLCDRRWVRVAELYFYEMQCFAKTPHTCTHAATWVFWICWEKKKRIGAASRRQGSLRPLPNAEHLDSFSSTALLSHLHRRKSARVCTNTCERSVSFNTATHVASLICTFPSSFFFLLWHLTTNTVAQPGNVYCGLVSLVKSLMHRSAFPSMWIHKPVEYVLHVMNMRSGSKDINSTMCQKTWAENFSWRSRADFA